MKIGLRGGHSANCLGAIGLRNEYEQMQTLYKYICNAIDPNIPLEKQENEEQKKEQKYKFATTKNVTTSLNIRSEANSNSNILASIPRGGRFYIMWTEIGWHYIKFYDIEGYVNSDYVKILE